MLTSSCSSGDGACPGCLVRILAFQETLARRSEPVITNVVILAFQETLARRNEPVITNVVILAFQETLGKTQWAC
jgi:hypothetical protein